MKHLGLSNEFASVKILPDEKFNLHSTGITLEEGGSVAVHDSTHTYVLGENIYGEGVVKLKLKIESFQKSDWMFVGMVKGNVVPQNDHWNRWPGTYGWAFGNNIHQGVWREGSCTSDDKLNKLAKQGDTVELVLDCDAAKLSLHLPTGQQQFYIDLAKFPSWRLRVHLHGANDKIKIVRE